MKWGPNGWVLDSGREIYANRGLLSVSPEAEGDSQFHVFEGYDGTALFTTCSCETPCNGEGDWCQGPRDPLTRAERREIRDAMVRLWMEWAER